MFSWICARCGRDNPPSASNCLSCGARFDEVIEEPVQTAPASAPDLTAPTPEPRRPTKRELPLRQATTSNTEARRTGLPTWLLTILFFFAIAGIGSGIYFGINYWRNRKQATAAPLESAANVARTKLSNPLQKSIEVVGIRLVQDAKKKPQVRFVVVNHSGNALDDLGATVTLWASTSRSEEDAVGSFTFKLPSIEPFASKELTAPLSTKLKFYELPDWQVATPETQITSP